MEFTPDESLPEMPAKPLPEYYSPVAIYVFSALFSTLFGAALMAINLKRAGQQKGLRAVLGFGMLFFAMQLAALITIPSAIPSYGAILFGLIGGFILNELFWKKYIGTNTLYTKRSVLVPAVIGIFLIVVLLGLVFAAISR